MATKNVVTKVWIEPGCIVCDACETTSPDVFEVQEENCIIRPEALSPDFTQPRTEAITDAAEECPVDVIKFETVAVDVSEADAAAATVSAKTPETAAESAVEAEATPAPAAPAQASAPAQAAAPVAAAKVSEGQADPGIAALLKATAARGGRAGILRDAAGETAEAWRRKNPSELPPDARQARVMEAAKKASKEPDLTRRKVAGGVALTVGWVAFGTGVGISIGPAMARFMMPNVLEEPDPRIRMGPLKTYIEMAPGSVNEDYKPQGIWVVRLEERIAALSIICTHLGCIPNWLPNDRKFKCPCHGSGYKPNGINFEGPTPRPLERFRIFVEGGLVIVDKSKKYQYELGQWDQPGSFIPV